MITLPRYINLSPTLAASLHQPITHPSLPRYIQPITHPQPASLHQPITHPSLPPLLNLSPTLACLATSNLSPNPSLPRYINYHPTPACPLHQPITHPSLPRYINLSPTPACLATSTCLYTVGALDLLKELRAVPMTLELLQVLEGEGGLSTRIGMSVNAIRKQSTDDEVTSLAKALIKSWKKLLDEPGGGDKSSEEKRKEPSTPTSTVSPTQGSPEPREESNDSSSKSEPVEVMPSISLISTFPQAPSTSDSVRIKCREMLSQALQAG
ncbi:unnamed protein product, partial [Coregonus sp. 'balchen']